MLSKIQKQGFVPLKTSITALSAALCWLLLASLPPDARAACNPPYDMNCCVEVQSNECVRMAEFTVTPDDDQCVYFPNNATSLVITAGVSVYREITGRMKFIVEKMPDPEIPGAICAYAKREWEEDTEGDIVCQWSVTGPTNCPSIPTSGTGFTAQATVCGVGEYIFNFEFAASGQCVNLPSPVSVTVNVLPMPVLSFSPAMIGLDRTDDGPEHKEGTATVTASFCPDAEPYYSWSAKAGVCEIPEGQPSEGSDLSSVTYRTPDKEQCSELYLDQTVSVDVSPIGSVSSNLFTVVKVDVEIGCVDDEALEESVGAFVKLDINDYNGREYDLYDMGWLKSVSITCEPEDLPEEEIVSISCDGVLYELKDDGKLYVAADEYVAASVKDRTFYLQGKSVSGDLADKEITVTHDTSKAVDKAKFTVVAVVVEPINKTYKNKACLTNSAADFYGAEFIMPDALMSNMTWNVDYGYVEIISQREKTAYVQANALGAFTVTLDVDKSDTRFSTYDLPSPYINGEVVEEVVVPVHFIIASDGVTTVSVPSLQEVNQRFSQVGMRFYVASCSTNQSEDALWIRSDKPDDELKNVFTNNFSGILVYCIDSFDGPPDDDDDDDDEEDEFDIGERGGMTYSSSSGYHGIVLSRHDHLCLSHEVGHYCGLLDILHSENGDAGRPLTDEENIVRIGRVRIGDWSGGVASGYYSHGINMRNIISRLMMNQQSSFGPDIPLSSTVHGLNVDNDDYGPVNVGYEAMNRNLQTAVPPWSFWPIF